MIAPQTERPDTLLLKSYLDNPSKLDEGNRERLIAVCQDLITSLETPIETARKHAFLTLDHAVVRSAIQLGIFQLLSTSDEPFTTQDLATATTPPCDAPLLSRLLRYLASPLRLIVEDGPGRWRVNRRGSVFADPGFQACCSMYFDSCGPAFQALPAWVSTTTPRAPTPFRLALPDEDGYFPWLRQDSNRLNDFHTWMDVLAKHQYTAQQRIDFNEWIPHDTCDNDVVFVDVGGGTGGQCIKLRERRGLRAGRIINQDRAEVAESARGQLVKNSVEAMAHDFFAEQPLKGAYVYHFRQIFHDWPDKDCIRILERIKGAMTASSTLLIDEVVLPEQGAHWMITQRDLTMLSLFNAAERSETQWRELLAKTGLRIEEIRCYDERMAACVIVAKLELKDF